MPRFHSRKRRRFRRSRKGRFLRFVKKRFARKVRSVILRTTEPKRLDISTQLGIDQQQGDSTSRVVNVKNLSSNLTQGVQRDQFIGDKVYLKGIAIRGQASVDVGNGGFQGYYIRWTIVWSRFMANGMTGNGATYNSTTTATVQPAQTNPQTNPHFFEGTGAQIYVGEGFALPFDNTACKVIASKTLKVNAGGNGYGCNKFKFFLPIRANFQYLDPNEGDLSTAPNAGRYGNYYLVTQVIMQASPAGYADNNIGLRDERITIYFKDV